MLSFDYLRPQTCSELADMLAQSGGRLIAGGTDVLPGLRRGQLAADCLIDISGLRELRYIREEDGEIQIGALATHADLIASPLLQRLAPGLIQAVATVGCPQTRYRGTLGGNLANASPAADSAPPLLTLECRVHLSKAAGMRSILLRDFFAGPGKTCLAAGEYIHHLSFPRPPARTGSAFTKLGKRSGMAISVASAAAFLELAPDGRLQTARLAFGSVAPCPTRGAHGEEFLLGKVPGPELFRQAGQLSLADVAPIGDVRASAAYRRHVIPILAERTLAAAWKQARERLQ
ncbi:MAG TPA: xanthine dehydrogenase family protein subunit M [Anaerolineaceae bacterium]